MIEYRVPGERMRVHFITGQAHPGEYVEREVTVVRQLRDPERGRLVTVVVDDDGNEYQLWVGHRGRRALGGEP